MPAQAIRHLTMGRNPYIDDEAPPPPKQRYKVTVRNTGQVIEVDPEALPENEDGHLGSLLGILLAAPISSADEPIV